LPAFPFYFLELLVGFVQALVFALLTAVFLKLMTDHDDHGHDESHGDHDEAATTAPEASTT
jgi:F-type H+-transporting ATPase subunit a